MSTDQRESPTCLAATGGHGLYLRGLGGLLMVGCSRSAPADESMKAESTAAAAGKHYARIVRAFAIDGDVAVGAGRKKGFGANALTVRGKIFALLSSRGHFVVKLPRDRVDALVAAGRGGRFDPGHGRLMKEWLDVAPGAQADWLALAREARAFVAGRA